MYEDSLVGSSQQVCTRVQILAILRVAEETDVWLVVFLRATRLEDVDVCRGLPVRSHIHFVDWKSKPSSDEQDDDGEQGDPITAEFGGLHVDLVGSFRLEGTVTMTGRGQDGDNESAAQL